MPLGSFKLNSIANQFFQRPRNVFTLGGNAQISTAQSQFGGSSLLLDGNGDYCLSTTNPPVWRWSERNQYTVECWVYMIALSGSQFYNDPQLIGNIRTDGFDNQWAMGPDNDGDLTFKYYNGSDQRIVSTGSKIAINTWYHLAAVINGTSVKIYQNGTEVGSGTWSGSPFNNDSHGINIGGGYQNTFNGYVDEVRISNIARYTSGFTPSTTPFSNDANTLLLLHFNEPNASTTITDDASEVFGAVQNLSIPTTATSTASTITVPATAAANDIAILFDTSTTTTDTSPSGWTSISKTTTTGIRTNISYKKLVSGDVSSSITGMAGTTRKVMVIVRANVNPTNIMLSNASAQSTTSAPNNQSLTLANNLTPIIGFACYAKTTSTTPTRGWTGDSPSEYSSVSTSGVYVKALVYNQDATPVNATISMTDAGTNTLQSFYLHLS